MSFGCFNSLDQRCNEVLNGSHNIAAAISPSIAAIIFITERVLRQCCAQAFQHAVVVDDDAAVLAGVDAVGSGDGLHQIVSLHWFVNVERRQALHVETGQAHRTHNGDAERVLRILEGVLDGE